MTTALHAFFAGVPNGSTIVFPAHAQYRIEGTIRLRDRHDLTFAGNGATLFATTALPAIIASPPFVTSTP